MRSSERSSVGQGIKAVACDRSRSRSIVASLDRFLRHRHLLDAKARDLPRPKTPALRRNRSSMIAWRIGLSRTERADLQQRHRCEINGVRTDTRYGTAVTKAY